MQVAIDYSSSEAIVCLKKEGELMTARKVFKHREAGLLQHFLDIFFKEQGVDVAQVNEWYVGVGPGSFTTLRLSVATVLGFATSRSSAKVMGVPSALGMVSQLDYSIGEVFVLYDGRNQEALYFGMTRLEKGWVPNGKNGVVSLTDLSSLNAPLLALEADKDLFANSEKQPTFVSSNDVTAFFETSITLPPTELIYLRPAVFTQPIVLRADLPI